jgi:hypothetical protein
MPYITSQLMAHIKSHALQTYTDTCLIERNIEVTDNRYGSKEPGWQVVGADVPCRLITLNRSNQSLVEELASQDTMLDSYQLVIPSTQEIERDYRVTISGETYAVTRIESSLTDLAFKQVLIIRKR